MKRFMLWFSLGLLLLLLVSGYALYTAPFGSGEYRTSPDDRYCAHATSYSQRRLFAATKNYQDYYIEAQTCEQAASQTIWQVRYYPSHDQPLDYGMRDIRLITWASDSESVTFMLDAKRLLTIPVP